MAATWYTKTAVDTLLTALQTVAAAKTTYLSQAAATGFTQGATASDLTALTTTVGGKLDTATAKTTYLSQGTGTGLTQGALKTDVVGAFKVVKTYTTVAAAQAGLTATPPEFADGDYIVITG